MAGHVFGLGSLSLRGKLKFSAALEEILADRQGLYSVCVLCGLKVVQNVPFTLTVCGIKFFPRFRYLYSEIF